MPGQPQGYLAVRMGETPRRQKMQAALRGEGTMQEKQIKSYFKQQVRALLARSATEPNGFRAYFEGREPRDEEILGLLAVSTVLGGQFHERDSFPTPLEALAALSRSGRAEVCREFRKQLKHSHKQSAHA